jgi:ribosomal protein L16 Arg81 hydroxylase
MSNTAWTLEDLVAPLPEAAFLPLLRERKLTLVRGTGAHPLTELVSWEALRRLIERGEYPRGRDDIRVSKESEAVPQDRWTTNGKVDTTKLEVLLAKGYNIVITHIEQQIAPLATLCANIKLRLSEVIFAGVIVTTGIDGAFKRHYDPEDLVILQIEGSKRWQIFGPAVSNPVMGMPKQSPPQGEPIFDEVLHAGDILLVPGGNWHHCENGPGRSVHVGIFFIPPTPWHAVDVLSSRLLSEEMFRTRLSRVENDAELATLEVEIKKRLIEKIGELNLDEFVAEWGKKRKS